MKAHLLNWMIGPALLGIFFGSVGYEWPTPSLADLLNVFPMTAGIALFFGLACPVLLAIMVMVQRFAEGRFNWAEVRTFAIVMAVKIAMMLFALGLLMTVVQLAAIVLGNWHSGWRAGLAGAGVGAAVGLPVGLFVAWLKIPERLGLDKPAPLPAATDAGSTGPASA
jgi:hypothetical protein